MSDDVHYSKIVVPSTTAFKPPLVSVLVEYLVLLLTLLAFIYGVTSWCMIKKFRNFKNYVYLNTIVSSLFRLTTVSLLIPTILQVVVINEYQLMEVCRYICTYFTTVQNYWLLVLCYIFYGDIVKVFHEHVHRRFLKSSLFAWGVPLVTFVIYNVYIIVNREWLTERTLDKVANYVEVLIIVSPLIINCFIYLMVVCSLCYCSKVKVSATNTWRRFYIATLLFVLSDVIVLSSFIWDLMNISFVVRAIMSKMQSIAIDLFLPLVRNNRDLWKNYRNKVPKNIQIH